MADKSQEARIEDLKPDPKNARKRTQRSSKQIRDSLQEFGGMRSIVIDENNRIWAGNGTVEEAAQVGIEKVRIIEANGDELIAVRRRGLTEKQWMEYALRDNRSSDLAEWETEILKDLRDIEGIDLGKFWSEEEQDDLFGFGPDDGSGGDDDTVHGLGSSGITYENKFAVAVECDDEAHQEDVYNKLMAMGYRCKVLTL